MDNFFIIQIYLSFFLMFVIHVYFLFNKLFIKEKKVNFKDGNIIWVLIGLFLIIAVSVVFFYEFLLNSADNFIVYLGAFGAYFGGIVAPLLTFITLIILIKQISITREANSLQIEHLNKTRRIEMLTMEW